MTYAQPSDVAQELRGSTSVTPAETIQWQAWLDRVERAIRRRFKRAGYELDEQVGQGDPTETDVMDVEVAAVIRQYRYADSVGRMAPGMSRTRSLDDGSITDRNDSRPDVAYDPLALTPDEWSSLLPEFTGSAFSTRPGFVPDGPTYDPWVNT